MPKQALEPVSSELVGPSLSISFAGPPADNNVWGACRKSGSLLLRLPPEIRLAIYQAVLIDSFDGICILQTCPQINMEAREFLYHRSSTFDSQATLFAWVERSRIANLNRVRKITLRLTDVDLNSILETQNAKRQTRTTVWSLYKKELQKLEQSLSAVPNVTSLTIVPPRIGNSLLLRNMYQSFLAEIPRRCPRLERLEIRDSDILLETVPALKSIRKVTFKATSFDAGGESKDGRRNLQVGSGSEPEGREEKSARSAIPLSSRHSTWVETVLG